MTHVVPTLVIPEISKDLILGMDFLNQFGFQLALSGTELALSSSDKANTVAALNGLELNFAEGYFGESEHICFQLVPSPISSEQNNSEIEDASLEMPTVEIPENVIQSPSDITTEHPLSEEQKQSLFNTIQYLPATKDGHLGRTDLIKHEIELLPGAKPKKVTYYRWSPTIESVIDAEIERMRKLGVIEECLGAVDFLNPLLPVKKQVENGGSASILDA